MKVGENTVTTPAPVGDIDPIDMKRTALFEVLEALAKVDVEDMPRVIAAACAYHEVKLSMQVEGSGRTDF